MVPRIPETAHDEPNDARDPTPSRGRGQGLETDDPFFGYFPFKINDLSNADIGLSQGSQDGNHHALVPVPRSKTLSPYPGLTP